MYINEFGVYKCHTLLYFTLQYFTFSYPNVMGPNSSKYQLCYSSKYLNYVKLRIIYLTWVSTLFKVEN